MKKPRSALAVMTAALTFGPGVPIYNFTQCGGIHGHVKVAPDGTVYVPNKQCGATQGVAMSADNGLTWTVEVIPDSLAAIGLTDPSLGIASDGTIYFGYQDGSGHPKIAVSHDRGNTWISSIDAGAQFGIQNSTFPEVVAGDPESRCFHVFGYTNRRQLPGLSEFHGHMAFIYRHHF